VSSYLQWSRNKPVRRVTWVCGPEPYLAREVVAAHLDGAPPGQCAFLFAGEVPEREVWDELLTCPPPGGRRTVVHGAEKLRNLGGIALLAGAGGQETAFTVFVSADSDFGHDGDGALAPHLAALRDAKAGQMVRCCAPSKAEDQVALVASWWPGASRTLAYDVLSRCGTLEAAYQACEQARLAALEPTAARAALVCQPRPGDRLADYLLAGDRRRAMEAAAVLPRGETGRLIGLLASLLVIAEGIGEGVHDGMTAREAAGRLRADRFSASRVVPYAAAYGTDRIRRCRRVLAGAEAAWKSGAGSGVAESVVSQWLAP
jgi:hypothetical protein